MKSMIGLSGRGKLESFYSRLLSVGSFIRYGAFYFILRESNLQHSCTPFVSHYRSLLPGGAEAVGLTVHTYLRIAEVARI
jgi:hypothetical protein